MKTLITTLLAIVLMIVACFGIWKVLESSAPVAKKKEIRVITPVVETALVVEEDFAFSLLSDGVVETRRETVLSAQVGGKIVEMHPDFEQGARFKDGEIIARIDPLNYRAAVAQARSSVEDARLALTQEETRGVQAARDWKKISGDKEASDLVLRKPYLKAAEARLVAAQALLDQRIEDLERTLIRAPFACRVRQVSLNLGATVAPGTRLGMIYADEELVVRLPFSMDDYALIPEGAEFVLHTLVGGKRYEWKAELLRDLGEVDRRSFSAFLLVKVLPNEEAPKRFRLPNPGLYVDAEVSGAVLEKVLVVPRTALHGRAEVYLLNDEDLLEYRELTIARSTKDSVYATAGVEVGERVIVTKVEMASPGMSLMEAKKSSEN